MIDGVIKYKFAHKKTAPLKLKQYSEIETIRERLFTLGLIGVDQDGIGFGNISQRSGKKSFIISGTQTGELKTLNAAHYSSVQDFNLEQFYLSSIGIIKPSSEALTHASDSYSLKQPLEIYAD